jgi:signal transduction histidine kinase
MANQDSSNRTLARELHHVVSQKLAFLALEVSALGQRPWRSAPALRRWIDHLGTEIGRTAVHVHELSGGLYPLAVEDLGLKAALRAECREFSGQYGVPCRFHWSGAPETIPLPVALCLYRVAQEALRNAGRHAGAEHVEIRVVRTRLAIEMMVSDTGAGFRVDGVKTGGGLLTMEERSRMIGGEFEVTSTEGRGTTLVVRAPLKAGVA